MLNSAGENVNLTLTTENYIKFIHGAIRGHLQVSVPTRIATYIRVGLQDVPANKFGVVEIPTETISHLAPAVYTPAPTPNPTPTSPTPASSNSTPPSTTPSTPPAQPATPNR